MKKCCKGVMWKASVSNYRQHHLRRLLKLKKALINGKYRQSKGTHFKVYEPKERDIVSTLFKDRVPITSLIDNYLYDEVCLKFEAENCACQKNKGTDYARNLLKALMRYIYSLYGTSGAVLSVDIHHFFASIRHDIAKEVMDVRVSDEFAIGMVHGDIDTCDGNTGIDLGSPMNQLIALAMLDDLDKRLRQSPVVFVRYMDDIIILGKSKEVLKEVLEIVKEELDIKALTLNSKKTHIAPITKPISFLGFSFLLHKTGRITMRPLKKKVAKRRRKLKRQAQLVIKGVISKEQFAQIYKGGRDHFKKGTRSTLRKMDAYFNALMEEINMQEEIIELRKLVEKLESEVFELKAEVAKLKMDKEEDQDVE